MKFVLIPDSFKGTMSSSEICSIMAASIRKFYPRAEVIGIPVADGGEGSVDAFLAAVGGEKRSVRVTGPCFDKVDAFYGLIDGGKTAVIEMAASSGLPLAAAHGPLNPEKTTTYGAGELVAAALRENRQCGKIIMGLGGSATNDGGCGAAAALGVRFINGAGKDFIPTGGTLGEIEHIDTGGLEAALKGLDLVTMCDIDTPLCGENGAARVFGPQKGAGAEMIASLDEGLRHLASVVKKDLGADLENMKGAGAAGGMGYGMKAFLGFVPHMGIETVLDTVQFDGLLTGAAMVFSGEGKIDTQSLRGKVVIGVAKRTKRAGVPLTAVVGDIGDDIEEAYDRGVSAIFSINRVAVDYAAARLRAKSDLALTMDTILRFMRLTVK
ncbi:MAG: glycerate kinase [Treponema sp.]|jgi:glycerate kinase|nr:glycerate kinase [Treponema sp.]